MANKTGSTQPAFSVTQPFEIPYPDQRGISNGYVITGDYNKASEFIDPKLENLALSGLLSMSAISPGGTYLFGSGNVGAPGIGWAADTDTGWYWLSSGKFGITSNGVKVADWSSSGLTLSAMTAGSVLFAGTGGLVSQNNSSLFWDNTNFTLKLTKGASANPYLFIGPAGNSTTGQFVMQMSSSESSTKKFNLITAEKVNTTDPRNNVHYKLGYNIDKFSQAPEDTSEPSLYFAWETFFQTGAERAVEAYVEYLSASATPVLLRPWYSAVSRLTNTITSVLHSSNNHYWYLSADQSALASNYLMNLSSSGLTIDPSALFSLQLLQNSVATPTTAQYVARANSLGSVSLLAYAASNVHVCFDLDWASSAFKARNATCARISSNAGTLDFVTYGGQTVGSGVTGAILSVSIDEATGNRTYTAQDLKANGTVAAPSDSWSAQTGFGWRRFGTGSLALTDGTNDRFIIIGTAFPGITVTSAGNYSFTNSGDARTGTADLTITRSAAGSIGFGGIGNGQKINVSQLTELTTIAAAATTDTAIQIPLDAVVFAVSVRVTVVIPTAATFTVTGTTSATQFDVAGGVAVAAGTTDVGTRNCPYKNGAAQTIRITPNINPANNSGRVRVTIHYYQITPATS